METKMRVWWRPQVGTGATFFIPVKNEEEASKFISILAAYDCFQYNHHIKPDYCNTGGVHVWNDTNQEWEDWEYEDDESYYDNVDQYIDEKSELASQMIEFTKSLFDQVNFE